MRGSLTKKQIATVVDYVTRHAYERRRNQGAKFNEVDFAMGAAAVFFALGLSDQVPAAWLLSPLGGRPIFPAEESL